MDIYNDMQNASIVDVLGQYPGLTWKELAKPQYKTPESIPLYVETVNKLIMGTGGDRDRVATPTIRAPSASGGDGPAIMT